jgi:hypothetical protein
LPIVRSPARILPDEALRVKKTIPVTGRGDPQGGETSRLPYTCLSSTRDVSLSSYSNENLKKEIQSRLRIKVKKSQLTYVIVRKRWGAMIRNRSRNSIKILCPLLFYYLHVPLTVSTVRTGKSISSASYLYMSSCRFVGTNGMYIICERFYALWREGLCICHPPGFF